MNTLDLTANEDGIFIIYSPNSENANWVLEKVKRNGSYFLKRIFHLQKEDLPLDSKEIINFVKFKIADVVEINEEKFYFLNKRIFGISFNFYIILSCKDKIAINWFIGARNVSIPKILEQIGVNEDLFIGGKTPTAISEREYQHAIKALPTNTELDKYVNVRVYREFSNFIRLKKDSDSDFKKYLEKKNITASNIRDDDFKDFNIARYESFLGKLKQMLKNESCYETIWEREIIKFIQLLYPKYVLCKAQVFIKTAPIKNKRLDFLLADADGNIDIVEIKRPHKNALLTNTNSYRDNYVPLRELSGTIMQCEKYIYHLMRNAEIIERDLNEKYKTDFPPNYSLKIINPKAILIMGREVASEQKEDFEIIRRKYKNVIDIITYDDLLNRLKTMLHFFELNQTTLENHYGEITT